MIEFLFDLIDIKISSMNNLQYNFVSNLLNKN